MDRIITILISLVISILIYLGFVFALRREVVRAHFGRHWYLHPNAICAWRVVIGFAGILLYSLAGYHFWGILMFTISAVMDGVDGLIARNCDLVTPLGEEIDPLCDKLTYLPPFFFAFQGLLDMTAIWILLIIEFCGQFVVRYIIKRFTSFSVQANTRQSFSSGYH